MLNFANVRKSPDLCKTFFYVILRIMQLYQSLNSESSWVSGSLGETCRSNIDEPSHHDHALILHSSSMQHGGASAGFV